MYGSPYPYQHPGHWQGNMYESVDGYWPAPNAANYAPHQDGSNTRLNIKDYGMHPFVTNINQTTKQNNTFRTAIWTGNHLQVTLMSLKPGEDIGLEVHPNVDQFLRVEQGQGIAQMGPRKNHLNYQRRISDDSAIFVPAGTWHNITNTGNGPLKLYSIYGPPNHPFGTVHRTKADAMAMEHGRQREHFNRHESFKTFL